MSSRVKGVRDFIGKEALIRAKAISSIKETYEAFGFEPLETPVLEYLSLFTEKSGPEIEAQLYAFSDKKGEKLALRPEHTVSKLRVISENKSLVMPFKAYSIGNVWRYEDTAKGRYREFVQADVDVYGSSSIRYDAEIIACIDAALRKLGLSDYKVHLNNRKVLRDLSDSLGLDLLTGVGLLRDIDKLDKIGIDEVIKNVSQRIGPEKAEKVRLYLQGKYEIKSEGLSEIKELIKYLEEYGIRNVVIDNALVRGLAYYDGNIFEFISEDERFKGTIAGGGRYDNLSKKFDVTVPVVGASIGFERVMEILLANPLDDYFEKYCVVNVDNMPKAVEVVKKLRETGRNADILLEKVSLSKALDYCNSKKIRYAVIVGKKDLENGEVTIRDMKEHTDKKIKYAELASD